MPTVSMSLLLQQFLLLPDAIMNRRWKFDEVSGILETQLAALPGKPFGYQLEALTQLNYCILLL